MSDIFYRKHEESEYDISEDINQILADTIGENISEIDKLKFQKYITHIIHENANELLDIVTPTHYSNDYSFKYSNSQNHPIINIYLCNQPIFINQQIQ